MPPRRAARAGSVGGRGQAPTRTSRRLRGQQENDSPLRFLEVPTRRKRTVSATTPTANQETLHKSPSPERLVSQDSEDIKDEVAEMQATIRELQEQLNEKERLVNKLKRSASIGEEAEDIDQERPAQRLRLTPTMRRSITPEPSSPSQPQTLSSPLAGSGASGSPAFSSPLVNMSSSSRQNISSPASNTSNPLQSTMSSSRFVTGPSTQTTQTPTPLFIDEQDEDTELSFFVYGNQSPVQPTKFESYVKQRMLEKERLRQEHEWLGNCLIDPDLPLPGGSDGKLATQQDATPDEMNDETVSNLEINHKLNASNPITLSPIREESEPATPQTGRWGLSKIFAPVARFLGRTPRSEPPRRIPQGSGSGTSAPKSTPSQSHSSSHSSPFHMSPAKSPASVASQPPQVEEEPVTPTPHHGITAANFYPHSAPQVRTSEPVRRRKTHSEKIKAYATIEARRKAAAEKERQKQWELDEIKWQREAAEIRQRNIEAQQKTGQKRKVRVDDLTSIPNPVNSGYGMDEKYFEEDSDGEVYIEEDITIADASTPPPAKKVRFNGPSSVERGTNQKYSSTEASSPKKSSWRQDADNFNKVSPWKSVPDNNVDRGGFLSRPYTGTMFADPISEDTLLAIDNIFGTPKMETVKKHMKNNMEQNGVSTRGEAQKGEVQEDQPQKSPARKSQPQKHHEAKNDSGFNWSGHFTVPDDDSDEESDLEDSSKTDSSTLTKSSPNQVSTTPNLFMASAANNDNEQPLTPPPPPTPAHAALPTTPGGLQSSIDSDALAKARSIAEKYKPKTPSGLRATSRLSSSPTGLKSSLNRDVSNIFGATPFSAASPTPTNTQTDESSGVSFKPDTTKAKLFEKSSQDHAAVTSVRNTEPSTVTTNTLDQQTTQYAIQLANAVPIESLRAQNFTWPASTPLPWPLDPEVEAALDAAEQHADWPAYCEKKWQNTWETYLKEKANGKHGDILTNPPTNIPTPLTV